jgi:hypothetical protein
MSQDSVKILDSLLKSDKINDEEKEAIRDSILDMKIWYDWIKIEENLEIRLVKNVKTDAEVLEYRNSEEY